jgi:hypothetical protein
MSSIANPNWLAVGAALFGMCGTGLLTKALLQGSSNSTDSADRQRAAAVKQVSATAGAPILGIGVFMHALSQVATASLSPLLTSILLGLAFLMLLYACLEDLAIETLIGEKDTVRKAPRLALLPPATPEVVETVMEPIAVEAAR